MVKNSISNVLIANGKVICGCEDGEFTNPSIYMFNADGSNRKKIGKGYGTFIYKKHIYWEQIKGSPDEPIYYRYCRCNVNGKNKKAVTKWIPDSEYFKIGKKVDYDIKKTYFKIAKIKKWKK